MDCPVEMPDFTYDMCIKLKIIKDPDNIEIVDNDTFKKLVVAIQKEEKNEFDVADFIYLFREKISLKEPLIDKRVVNPGSNEDHKCMCEVPIKNLYYIQSKITDKIYKIGCQCICNFLKKIVCKICEQEKKVTKTGIETGTCQQCRKLIAEMNRQVKKENRLLKLEIKELERKITNLGKENLALQKRWTPENVLNAKWESGALKGTTFKEAYNKLAAQYNELLKDLDSDSE